MEAILIYFMPGTMLGTQEKLKLCNTWALVQRAHRKVHKK